MWKLQKIVPFRIPSCKRKPPEPYDSGGSTSEGIRTPVSALRGPRARPLHNGGKYGWGTRIRTLNDRVRAERVTVTPFPIGFRSGFRLTAGIIISQLRQVVNTFFHIFRKKFVA